MSGICRFTRHIRMSISACRGAVGSGRRAQVLKSDFRLQGHFSLVLYQAPSALQTYRSPPPCSPVGLRQYFVPKGSFLLSSAGSAQPSSSGRLEVNSIRFTRFMFRVLLPFGPHAGNKNTDNKSRKTTLRTDSLLIVRADPNFALTLAARTLLRTLRKEKSFLAQRALPMQGIIAVACFGFLFGQLFEWVQKRCRRNPQPLNQWSRSCITSSLACAIRLRHLPLISP